MENIFDIYEPLSKELEKGIFFSFGEKAASSGIAPKCDVRFIKDKIDTIVDAKDYSGAYEAKVMGYAGDHYKQIIYGHLAFSAAKKNINLLAFPSQLDETLFFLHGYHFWERIPNSLVFEVFVDFETASKMWTGEYKTADKKDINDLFEKIINISY